MAMGQQNKVWGSDQSDFSSRVEIIIQGSVRGIGVVGSHGRTIDYVRRPTPPYRPCAQRQDLEKLDQVAAVTAVLDSRQAVNGLSVDDKLLDYLLAIGIDGKNPPSSRFTDWGFPQNF
jgi:hypothetical protein